MPKLLFPSLLAFCLLFSGFYQSRITTDKTPGKTVKKKWATGFINGLAMTNSNINAGQECPNGVASVETKLSFLNQLVGGLTFGLYSPMTVKVTCAASSSTSSLMKAPNINFEVPEDAATMEVRETVMAAASKSAQSEKPVYIQFSTE